MFFFWQGSFWWQIFGGDKWLLFLNLPKIEDFKEQTTPIPTLQPENDRSSNYPKSLVSKRKNKHIPRPSNRCFLEAFKYLKTTRKHRSCWRVLVQKPPLGKRKERSSDRSTSLSWKTLRQWAWWLNTQAKKPHTLSKIWTLKKKTSAYTSKRLLDLNQKQKQTSLKS